MTYLTMEAHDATKEFEDTIFKEFNVVIVNRRFEPWSLLFSGTKENLLKMYSKHWTDGSPEDALPADSCALTEEIPFEFIEIPPTGEISDAFKNEAIERAVKHHRLDMVYFKLREFYKLPPKPIDRFDTVGKATEVAWIHWTAEYRRAHVIAWLAKELDAAAADSGS